MGDRQPCRQCEYYLSDILHQCGQGPAGYASTLMSQGDHLVQESHGPKMQAGDGKYKSGRRPSQYSGKVPAMDAEEHEPYHQQHCTRQHKLDVHQGCAPQRCSCRSSTPESARVVRLFCKCMVGCIEAGNTQLFKNDQEQERIAHMVIEHGMGNPSWVFAQRPCSRYEHQNEEPNRHRLHTPGRKPGQQEEPHSDEGCVECARQAYSVCVVAMQRETPAKRVPDQPPVTGVEVYEGDLAICQSPGSVKKHEKVMRIHTSWQRTECGLKRAQAHKRSQVHPEGQTL